MNIKQMHIEINLGLQKIGTNVKRVFYPEELDWLLNKNIVRFINNNIRKDEKDGQGGFEYDMINAAALSTLIETDISLPTFISSVGNVVIAPLPGDTLYPISGGRSIVIANCETIYPTAKAYITVTEYVYGLKVIKTSKTSNPYYENVTLAFNSSNVNIQFPVNAKSSEMNFDIMDVLKNNLKEIGRVIGVKVYWERYKDIYKPQELLFVKNSTLSTVTLSYDTTNNQSYLISSSQVRLAGISGITYVYNRPVKLPEVPKLQSSTFNKSNIGSPIVVFSGTSFKVYYDDSFIVTNVIIDYIKKPQIVSLALNKDCDIHSDFHQAICDMTVEYIQMTIGDPNYQAKLQDNEFKIT